MTGKYFTVQQLALAYEEGFKARHIDKVVQDPFEVCWAKSTTLEEANKIVAAAKMAKAEAAARAADDPNRDGNQVEAMAQVLRECRWFKYPEGTGEDKPIVWAEMLYDAAVHARQPSRIDPLSPVYEVKPVFRKIELTIHANMPPPVMLAAALAQALGHFDKDVTIAQAESAFELARKTLHEPDDHR